eukprot:IDg14123t1
MKILSTAGRPRGADKILVDVKFKVGARPLSTPSKNSGNDRSISGKSPSRRTELARDENLSDSIDESFDARYRLHHEERSREVKGVIELLRSELHSMRKTSALSSDITTTA